MYKKLDGHNNERGNALFIILITIALFVALSYTFTQSMDTGAETVTQGQNILSTSEILDYAKDIERAVHRISAKECSESDINFDNPVVAGYTNASAPVDNSCDIFDTNGGGLIWQSPSNDLNDGSEWIVNGTIRMLNLGSAVSELVILLPNLTQERCIQLNNRLNIDNPANVPPKGDDAFTKGKFTGSFSVADDIGGFDTEILDKTTYCFWEETPDLYHFIHTLIIR